MQNIYGEEVRWHSDWPWRVHTSEEQYERMVGLYWGYAHITPPMPANWTAQERREFVARARNNPRRAEEI